MQLSLLDYVLPPEESAIAEKPAAETNAPCGISIGDQVRVLRVDTLPAALIGQIGTIKTLITSDIAQIRIGDRLWGMTADQFEKIEAKPATPALFPDPPFEVNVGDRLRLIKNFREDLIGQVVVVYEVVRPRVVRVTFSDRSTLTIYTDNTEKLEPTTLLRWHQAKINHRRRVILELSLADPIRYAALIEYCEQEIEQTLAVLGVR